MHFSDTVAQSTGVEHNLWLQYAAVNFVQLFVQLCCVTVMHIRLLN